MQSKINLIFYLSVVLGQLTKRIVKINDYEDEEVYTFQQVDFASLNLY